MRLDALFRPRSIAILGASERPSIGRALMESATTLGYAGPLYPINPKYTEILGQPCYPSMRELPEPPDVVALCVSYTRIVESFRTVADKGAGAAVIYDGGFAEHGDEGRRRQAELVGMCREAGIALCGPNCMGILNPHHRSSVYMQEVRDPAGLAGNVALVSQSGSICIGMLADIRRFGFSHVVSSGNEAAVSTAQYLEALVDDADTRVIATFTEWIAEPERYVAALDRAADAGKPVVVLKVGRQERTRRAIGTHTGGLAGESAVFSAVLRAHRAIEVSDLDEHGIATIGGTRQGLGAIDHLARWAVPLRPTRRIDAPGGAGVASLLGGHARPTIHEHDAKRLLAEHGLTVVREHLVRSVDDARRAAHDVGYPVALKVVADDLPHRSDLGLVRVGLEDDTALEAAWAALERRLGDATPETSIAGLMDQRLVAALTWRVAQFAG
jgi:acyl-CoA synthetase (NDP forming)